jgi:hypothetical protein
VKGLESGHYLLYSRLLFLNLHFNGARIKAKWGEGSISLKKTRDFNGAE